MKFRYEFIRKSGQVIGSAALPDGGRKVHVELEGGGKATIELTREDLVRLVGPPGSPASVAG